jgi:hypothetical protein
MGGSVVGEKGLDLDPWRPKKPIAQRRKPTAVLPSRPQDLDVGQAGGVVDADVDELPADMTADSPGRIDPARVAATPAGDAVPVAGRRSSVHPE